MAINTFERKSVSSKIVAFKEYLKFPYLNHVLTANSNSKETLYLKHLEAISAPVAFASNRKTILSQKRPTLQKGMLFSKSISIQAQRKEISRVRRCRV
jgi:hypothetical protein